VQWSFESLRTVKLLEEGIVNDQVQQAFSEWAWFRDSQKSERPATSLRNRFSMKLR
jgi:hypothetical protein